MLLTTTPTTTPTIATSTSKDRDGNGRYKPIRKRNPKKTEENSQEFAYLDKIDTRMRFNNSKDPIYFAFDYIEKRSVLQLAGDLVKDSFFEITNFVSKVVK